MRLSRSGLARITSKLKQTGLENLVKSNMNGNLEGAVVRLIAQIVSNATRFGTLSRPNSGINIQVFTAIGRTRNYQILVQPFGSRQGAIVFIRSQSRGISREWEQESEYEGESKQSLQEADYEVKTRPKHPQKYPNTHTYDGRTYYSRTDAQGRVTKIAGSLVYTKSKRKPTPNVPYKRKGDQAGHLIAHSLGGPPKFTANFVAMKRKINSAGGDWGKMEAYIRKRLQAKNTQAWMSVKPVFANDKIKRPSEINVTVKFNRPPKEKTFNIQTP